MKLDVLQIHTRSWENKIFFGRKMNELFLFCLWLWFFFKYLLILDDWACFTFSQIFTHFVSSY